MKEILPSLEQWLTAGRQVALATLVRVVKSAPRQPGAVMAVNDCGEVLGSVSGGCVESALYEEAAEVLATGRPKLLTYGIADDQAFEVGLTCGGTIDVFVEPLTVCSQELLVPMARAVRDGRAAAVVTVIAGPETGAKLLVTDDGDVVGRTASGDLQSALVAEARAMLRWGATGLRHFGPNGEKRADDVAVFIESMAPPPKMFVFGAIDFAAAMVRMGKFLGYHVTLCDARPVFATRGRFPEADDIVVAWPHEFLAKAAVGPRDAVIVLTHDAKFDIPVLLEALATPAGFIGALGSRSTHLRRLDELRDAGAALTDLARICSPVGLDIGGRTPEETAISIAAELIALRNGRSGGRLAYGNRRIHDEGDQLITLAAGVGR